MKTYKGYGYLQYFPNWWLILKVDEDVCRFYRKLIWYNNKTIRLNPSAHGSHITVIAGKYEQPTNKEVWDKYSNESIEFEYDNDIKTGDHYYWISVKCPRIEEIRLELGLKPTIHWPWHLTVGNTL